MMNIIRKSRFARPQGRPRSDHRIHLAPPEQFEGRVVPAGVTGLSATFQAVGDHGLVTVTNNSTQNVRITVADYGFGPTLLNFFDQHFVDATSAMVKAGQTKTIKVDLECNAFNQIDVLANEEAIKDFKGVPNYLFDPNLVAANLSYNLCLDQGKHQGGGEDKVKGNEGLGNGVDPPPPGHAGDLQQNDDPGHGPGNPNKGFNSSSKK